MIHPYGPYWTPFAITMVIGAPIGLLGGLAARAYLLRATTARSVVADVILGGLWWSASAMILPPVGFPATLIRSLVGAFLIAVIYEYLAKLTSRLTSN
jgi:hypothetical protein